MNDKGGNTVGKVGICGDVGDGRDCGLCAKARGCKRRGLRKYYETWMTIDIVGVGDFQDVR